MAVAELLLQKVSKQFPGAIRAVSELILEVEAGELVTLLGPSGCGKTTTLRLIAGLESVDEGKILIRGKEISGLPAQERNVALIFQRPSLFPQLNIAANIGLPIRLRRLPNEKDAVEQAAQLFGVAELLYRFPETLSGGQQQRVALARAMVIQPSVLLLDEPMASLDPIAREQLREAISETLKRTATTALYVTHVQSEAMSLGGRIAIMNEGRIEQAGAAREIYQAPANLFVARFFGEGLNVLHEGDTIRAFRPSDACVRTDGPCVGVVTEVLDMGNRVDVTIVHRNEKVRISTDLNESVRIGETVNFDVSRYLRFDAASGKRLPG